MSGTPSNIPLQMLPIHALPSGDPIPPGLFAINNVRKPLLYLFQNQDSGFAAADHVVTSDLAELPLQIALWAAYLIPPGADPVVLAWDMTLVVCKFPTNQQIISTKTVWSRFPQTALQNPTFHFLISNIGTGSRAIYPGGTLAQGDVFSIWMKSKIADVNNTYQGNRWISAALFYYFTDSDLLIP